MSGDRPRLSAYLTTYESERSGLPYQEAIRSLCGLADEVVVVDAGSEDGTYQNLAVLAASEPKLRLFQYPADPERPDWGLFVLVELPARARRACRGTHCWTASPAEIVDPGHRSRVRFLCDLLDETVPAAIVPLIEYWGGTRHARRDPFPAACKLSCNLPWLTHQLPHGLGTRAADGVPHARAPIDWSLQLVDRRTGEPVPAYDPLPAEIERDRLAQGAARRFAELFAEACDDLPVVHDFTFHDLAAWLRWLRDLGGPLLGSYYREPRLADPSIDGRPLRTLSEGELELLALRLGDDGPKRFDHGLPDEGLFEVAIVPPPNALDWLRGRAPIRAQAL